MNILKRIWRAMLKKECSCGGVKPEINICVVGGAEIDIKGVKYINNLTLHHGTIITHAKGDGPVEMVPVLDRLEASRLSKIGDSENPLEVESKEIKLDVK